MISTTYLSDRNIPLRFDHRGKLVCVEGIIHVCVVLKFTQQAVHKPHRNSGAALHSGTLTHQPGQLTLGRPDDLFVVLVVAGTGVKEEAHTALGS